MNYCICSILRLGFPFKKNKDPSHKIVIGLDENTSAFMAELLYADLNVLGDF